MPLTRHPSYEPRLILFRYELYTTTPAGELFMVFVSDDVARAIEPAAKDGMAVILKHRTMLEKLGSDLYDRGRLQPDGLSVLVGKSDLGTAAANSPASN